MPEFVSGNIMIREHALATGATLAGHKHHFDHTSIVFSGSVRVRATVNGRAIEQVFTAPARFLVRAGVEHEITALEPTAFWCIYSHRDPQGSISQVDTGWREALE